VTRNAFGRIQSMYVAVTRVTLAPLLVRCGIFLSALAAVALAYPVAVLTSRFGGLLLLVAVLPAVAPKRGLPTIAALVVVAGWALSTSQYGEPVALWRLLGLATFLYLTHSLTALAALLPYDAVVAPETLIRWVLRTSGVVLGSAVLAVLLLSLVGRTGDRTHLVAALGGLAVAVVAAALLSRLHRRG
jgi:hypothetical protein